MEKIKYVPPNARKTIKKNVQIDVSNEQQFPSLSSSVVVKNAEWGINKDVIEEEYSNFQLELALMAQGGKSQTLNFERNTKNLEKILLCLYCLHRIQIG
jgi:hypothetical protein